MLDFSFEPYRQEMIATLKNFIKIESVKSQPQPNMPYGKGLFDALMYIQSTSERLDLECVNLFGHMAYVDYGFGQEMLGILAHIDVVPRGDGWTMPAFEGIEKDGKIYGRGAIDNKGPAIAALYALKALSDNCIQLSKKVRLIFGTDEETSWKDMDFYKKHEPVPDLAFSPDGEYPVINAEKGLAHIALTVHDDSERSGIYIESINAGTRPNVVPNKADCILHAPISIISRSISSYKCPIGAKFSCEEKESGFVHIAVAGKSAHGSHPERGINAAVALIQYLSTLPLGSGLIEKAIYHLSQKIGLAQHGENIGLDISDDISGRLTNNLGILTVKDNQLHASLDFRYPISFSLKDIDEKIRDHFGSFTIKYVHKLDPHYVPEDSELIVKLKEAYTEITGEQAYCKSIGGATYARAFDNAVTFGPVFPGSPSVEHGPDEYIEIDVMMKNAEIIANAIVKLCQ